MKKTLIINAALCIVLLLSGCTPHTKQLMSMGGESDRGRQLVLDHKYREAVAELERVVAEYPEADGRPWYWLGVAHLHLGQYPQAAAALERSFTNGNVVTGKGLMIPLRESAFDSLGWSYLFMDRYRDALKAFAEGLKWSPRGYPPDKRKSMLTGSGWAFHYLNEPEKADRVFRDGLNAPSNDQPLQAYALRGLAFVQLTLGDDRQAETLMKQANAMGNMFPDLDLALLAIVQGRPQDALSLLGGPGWIGAGVSDAPGGGVNVLQVANGSPAAAGGLRAGDVIVAMDGQPVTKSMDVVEGVKSRQPGTELALDVLRSGQNERKVLTVGSILEFVAKSKELQPVLQRRPLPANATQPPPPSAPATEAFPQEQASPSPAPEQAPAPQPAPETGPALEIDALNVIPDPVPAGSEFEIRVDVYASAGGNSGGKVSLTLVHSISRDGKLLKEFSPETFSVADGSPETIVLKTRASKKAGRYALDVRLKMGEKTASRSTEFSIR